MVDSQPKSTGLVWGLAATRRSVYIHQMNRVNYRYDSGHDDSTINIVMGIIIIINMGERETAHCMGPPNWYLSNDLLYHSYYRVTGLLKAERNWDLFNDHAYHSYSNVAGFLKAGHLEVSKAGCFSRAGHPTKETDPDLSRILLSTSQNHAPRLCKLQSWLECEVTYWCRVSSITDAVCVRVDKKPTKSKQDGK